MDAPGGEPGVPGGSPREPAGCPGQPGGSPGGIRGTPGGGPVIPGPAAGAPGIRLAAGTFSGVHFPTKLAETQVHPAARSPGALRPVQKEEPHAP